MAKIYDVAREGFRRASTREERVYEAATLFGQGRTGSDPEAQYRLLEAFSTSDFPVLLGDAFTKQAVAAQKDAVKEFEPILTNVTVDDFKRHKLVDLWGDDEFELVRQGEEYKSGTLKETELDHGAQKHGKSYGLTWELRRNREFSALANFPRKLGNGSVKGQNTAVAKLLTSGTGWNSKFFGSVSSAPFSDVALDEAIKELAQRKDHRGDLVSTDNLVLIHGPALRTEVNRVLKSTELEWKVANGNRTTTTRVANPFLNVVTPLESKTAAARLGSNAATGWALVQSNASELPSIIRTLLSGEETVDIRVKRDQGQRVGGGDVSIEDGSFNDDTIWFRGRDVYGIDPGFTPGVYASNGK